MSGGHLLVLDRAGREVKQYDLPSGLVTLGSSSSCDIRFMLPTVEPHHATVVVHDKQTVVHNVGGGETLVNGVSVSVAPLAHGDVLTVGGRELRWRYARPGPHRPRPTSLTPVLLRMSRVRARVAARRSLAPPTRPPRSPHRNSTPGGGGARQVAVVQPQRRDAADTIVVSVVTNIRRRGISKSEQDMSSSNQSEEVRGKSKSPKGPQMNLQNTTKASMWIESRKTSPRKHVRESPARIAREVTPRKAISAKKMTPLRMAVLKRAQSARKVKVTKIEAPLTIDHTKQAAIMLMTGHTPKKRSNIKPSNVKTPNLVVKKQGVGASARKNGRPSKNASNESVTSTSSGTKRSSEHMNPAVVITNATPRKFLSRSDTYSVTETSLLSPLLPNPKKSALKNSSAKRSSRKTESIKFNLSNLEDGALNSMDIVTASDAEDHSLDDASRDELSLHYSDSSTGDSPSPRKSIHAGEASSPRSVQSRSSRILEKTLGTTFTKDKEHEVSPPPLQTASNPKNTRGSMMVHKVLQTPDKSYSYRTTGSLSDQSWDRTVASGYKTRTLSLRGSSKADDKMESYSVIDLVSMETSNSRSVYSSASDASTSKFNTPQSSARRSMRSLGAHGLLASSTPAAAVDVIIPKLPRSQSATTSRTYDSFQSSSCQIISRRSKSLANSPLNTPQNATFNISSRGKCRSPLDIENIPEVTLNSTRNTRHRHTTPDHGKENVTYDEDTTKTFSTPQNTGDTLNVSDRSRKTKSFSTLKNSSTNITLNSTSNSRISKSSRARGTDAEMSSVIIASSPITSRRSLKSPSAQSPLPKGMSTPESQNSPEEAATPVLSIQSLLDSSRNISIPRQAKRGMSRVPTARKTIGSRMSTLRKQASVKSKSFTFGTTVSTRSRGNSKSGSISPNTNADLSQDDADMTPKKSIKLVHEAVKNKHSTAKRPKSIRSVIDNLNDSDIVKELFNSPVKRKLSQSMIEFSKKQLMEDETTPPRKATRNTIALTGITSNDSSMEQSPAITPEVFVSPLTAASSNKRNVTSKLRQWRERTAETNNLHVTVGNSSNHTPRQTHRKSVKNDLTKVSGIKSLFARSPRNRLTDVRIKELFAASPRNDLKRVPKLRLLFHKSPKNDLRDVSGVRELFKKRSPKNDLRNVSGVKTTMRRHSPKNDLKDVRGVRDQFRREKHDDLNNVSGIEELFNELHQTSHLSDANAETSFDLLMGIPAARAYPKAKSLTTKLIRKPKTRKALSLQNSFNLINDNVEDWLEKELRKRMHKDSPRDQRVKSDSYTRNSNMRSGQTPKNNLNVSKTKSNVSRELLKLATDTVEGNSPLTTSRVRNSTLTRTSLNNMVELKRSASEIYGAHMLPIKKRSLVETSRNRSGHKNSLPIKKRMVKHSTPMKSSYSATDNMTMNVSDMGRMSPIPPHDATNLNAKTMIHVEPNKERLKRKPVQTKSANAIPAADNIVNNKNTSASKELSSRNKEKTASPVLGRTTRNRRTNHNTGQNNVQRRRSSIVVKKKAPGLSPKPAKKEAATVKNIKPEARPTTRGKLNQGLQDNLTTKIAKGIRGKKNDTENKKHDENQHKVNKNNKGRRTNAQKDEVSEKRKKSPLKQTRATRSQKASADKMQTPKKMPRTKVLKLTVVVTKPSPNLKTTTTKPSKINGSDKSPMKNLQSTRKAKAEANKADKPEPPREIEDDARNEIKIRGGRGKGVSLAMKEMESEKVQSKYNSNSNLRANNKDLDSDPKPRRGRKTIAQVNAQDENKATGVKKRSTRNTVNVNENVNRRTRGNTAASRETIEPPNRRVTIKERSEDTGRNNKRKMSDKESPSKLRAGNSKVTNKTSRSGNIDEESAKTNFRLTKGRQAKINALGTNEKTPVTETKRGRTRKINKEESSEKPVEPKATRRRNTTKEALGGGASGTAKDQVKTKRNSKEEAKQKLVKVGGRSAKANITQNTAAEAQRPRAAGRKRKADADPSTAKAGPSPPKTRRAAAASPKLTRGRAAAQQPAPRARRR